MFAVRSNIQIARIQFALAGMNAHINHDLCLSTRLARPTKPCRNMAACNTTTTHR
jgi:hypothetical protein